jgi:TonB family protein
VAGFRAASAAVPRHSALAAAILAVAVSLAPCQGRSVSDESWGDRFRSGDDSDAALPSLYQENLEDFESDTAAPWPALMSGNDGVADARIVPTAGTETGRALGVRVLFLRRALSTLDLRPPAPIRIDGRCVGVSIRAYGAGIPHELRLLVLDYYGAEHELSLGRLDFNGWRRLEATIPLDERGMSAYAQDDRHYRDPAGLRVSGLRIAFDIEESYGQYIAYFDDLGALVDSTGETSGEALKAIGVAPAPAASPDMAATEGASASAPASMPASELASVPAAAAAQARSSVLAELERRIASRMTYPEAARLRGIEGSMILSFRVGRGGNLVSARVAKGSGSELLDRAGLELLRGAFPVENDSGLDLDLELPVTFRLEDARRD